MIPSTSSSASPRSTTTLSNGWMIFSFSGGSTICSRFWAPGRPRLCDDSLWQRRALGSMAWRRLSLSRSAALSGRGRRALAHEIKRLARDAAAHRAMLIVGRFLTGRRARQRTACLGTSGLALLSSASILNRFLAVIFIASARQRRLNYTLPWSRGARVIAAESHSKGKPLAHPARFEKGPGQASVASIPRSRCDKHGRRVLSRAVQTAINAQPGIVIFWRDSAARSPSGST